MRERPGGSGCCGGRGDHFGPSARWRSVPPRPHRAAERGARPSRRETRALPSPHWARAAVLAPVRTPPPAPAVRGGLSVACTGEGQPPRPATRRGQPLAAPLTGPPRGAGWREGARGRSPACSRQALRGRPQGLSVRCGSREREPAREEPTAHPALSLQLESLAHHQEGDTRGRRSPPAPVKEPGLSLGALARGARGLGMFSRPAFRSHV